MHKKNANCMIKLSIIIPIYGVEPYIKKCLLSCIHQGIIRLGVDYEIICVNDGTKDKSAEIAKRIACLYDGITVIDQENQGLSAARNAGTIVANGEYIWYVDSDDYIEENCLERIIPQLKDDIDILQLKWRLVYEDGRPPKEVRTSTPVGAFSGKDITERGGLAAPVPFSVLRSKFLKENHLEFVKGIYHEDAEFKPRVVYLAKKIVFDKNVCYNYLQRTSGSIMSSFKPKKAYDLMVIVDRLLNFAVSRVDVDDRKKWLSALSGPVSEMMFVAIKSKDSTIIRDTNDFLKKRPEVSLSLKYSPSFLLKMVGYMSILTRNALPIYKLFFKLRYR